MTAAIIRPAQPDDLNDILTLAATPEELFHAYPRARWPLTLEQLRTTLATRRENTALVENGRVLAFGNFFAAEPGLFCTLGNLMVAPSARGKGHGTRLIQHLEARARHAYAASEIRVSCFHSNPQALLLYTRLGYRPFGIIPREGPGGQRLALIHLSRLLGT